MLQTILNAHEESVLSLLALIEKMDQQVQCSILLGLDQRNGISPVALIQQHLPQCILQFQSIIEPLKALNLRIKQSFVFESPQPNSAEQNQPLEAAAQHLLFKAPSAPKHEKASKPGVKITLL